MTLALRVKSLLKATEEMLSTLEIPGPMPNFPAHMGWFDGYPCCVGAHLLTQAGSATPKHKAVAGVIGFLRIWIMDNPRLRRQPYPAARDVIYLWFDLEAANDDNIGHVQIAAIRIVLHQLVKALRTLYRQIEE